MDERYVTQEWAEDTRREQEREARGFASGMANLGRQLMELTEGIKIMRSLAEGNARDRPLGERILAIETVLLSMSTRLGKAETAAEERDREFREIRAWWQNRRRVEWFLLTSVVTMLLGLVGAALHHYLT